MLNKDSFDIILLRHPGLDFDLFASRLNHQISSYCSWQADPNSVHVDAFTMNWNGRKFYAFPPFSLLSRCLQKISQGRAQCVLIAPLWPTQTWFPVLLRHLCDQPWILLPRPDLLHHPSSSGPHPLHRNLHLMVCPVSGDPSAITIFQRRLPTFSWHPWRKGTKKQYATYVRKWMAFCRERKINCYSPPLSDALQFLLELFNQGLSYSTLNIACSASSTIVTIDGEGSFGSNHIVTRFMKGVFESRRPKPKYDKIWDVSVVLKHLSSLYPNEKLSLKDLTHKVLMLILLVSSQRGQSIHYLDLQHLTMEEDNYSFDVAEHVKTSTPRNPHTRIDIAAYEPDSRICPLTCLNQQDQENINKTKALRNNETNKPVSRDTVSRWTKDTLRFCGIDTKVFTAHSTRSASVSKANEKDVPVHEIMTKAGWKSAETFRKYYNKPVIQGNSLASAILDQ